MANEAAKQENTILQPGTKAPEFTLPATPDQKLSLSDFRGQPVVLAFYPEDWSPVCSGQIGLYNELLPEFQKYGAQVLGISVDSAWSHLAFQENKNIRFPLLSDFEPKGKVSREYGAYREKEGTAARALFVIDGDGVIRWSYLSPVGVNPGAEGILEALEKLNPQKEEDHAGSHQARQ